MVVVRCMVRVVVMVVVLAGWAPVGQTCVAELRFLMRPSTRFLRF